MFWTTTACFTYHFCFEINKVQLLHHLVCTFAGHTVPCVYVYISLSASSAAQVYSLEWKDECDEELERKESLLIKALSQHLSRWTEENHRK
jgi:hypothetical protein